MKVFVITHKKFDTSIIKNVKIYTPLLVGAKQHDVDYHLKDDIGEDNISSKNANYCELTGIYWIWKHSEENIIGICHYRRYFIKRKCILRRKNILKEQDISDILETYDIILPTKTMSYGGLSAKEQFRKLHDLDVWNKCKNIIREDYPEYYDAFCEFEEDKSGYCFNMSIMRWELFNNYCDWLFGILFKLESMVNFENYDLYNRRMFGFVAERLMNIWVRYNRLKVYECEVYRTDVGLLRRIYQTIMVKRLVFLDKLGKL